MCHDDQHRGHSERADHSSAKDKPTTATTAAATVISTLLAGENVLVRVTSTIASA